MTPATVRKIGSGPDYLVVGIGPHPQIVPSKRIEIRRSVGNTRIAKLRFRRWTVEVDGCATSVHETLRAARLSRECQP